VTTQPARPAAVARASALTSLRRAKLRPPMPGEHYIRRARLLDLCEEVARAPLTLVVAPAGTGKTSLVAGWTAESSTPTAWLSLDELDRDGVSFWSHVIAALETLAPSCGDHALAMLRRARSRTDAVDQLLAELDADVRPSAVFVIDDFHLVDGDDFVVESLARFVQNYPRWLHVVLMSRREPRLPIDRMRARGQLGEIRFEELRFAPDEAVELMTRLSPAMSEERIRAAVELADGWATSLQMAALAARARRALPAAPAPEHEDDLLVQRYVLHEVLADEAPELIEILCAAAVVPRINSVLAHAMTGRADAGELLQSAEERGLFLTHRGTGGWFDLHALVRRVLTAHLASRTPSSLTELHTRAAQWFEAAGEVVLALEQWLLADRPRDVLRLLSASHGPLYDSGREATVKRTIAAIPTAVAVGDLEAMLDFAWCHLLVNRRRFVELVDQLAWWAARANPSRTLRARVDVLRASAAIVSGRWVESAAIYRQVMLELGEACWQDPLGRFAANGVGREVALSERWEEGSDEVRQAEAALSRDPERRLAFEGSRALGEALAGRPLDALRVAAGVRRAAAVSDMTILRTELAVAEALAYRELGDRSRARAELAALTEAPAETMLFCRILAMCELAQAHLDGGDLDSARQVFDEAEAIVEAESLGTDVRCWLTRLGTVLALASDDHESAGRWAAQVDDPFWSAIGTARVQLATGDEEAATVTLDMAVPRCVRHEVVLALLKSRASADRDEALKYASTAVETASRVGLLQTVASEGPKVIELVEHAAWRAPAEWLDRLRRSTAEASARGTPAGVTLVEPLTERERDVLRFLPSRLTVREIADELFVSVNTVKFHLRVIYRKLGVTSRVGAADVARRMTNISK
jgi:LuxR family transcriptional regulator, maltose regulon positive regulatory protein